MPGTVLDHKDRNRHHRLVRQVDGLVADRAFRKRPRRCDEAMVPGSRELGRAAPRKQVKSIRPGEGRRLADFWGEAQVEDESPELEVLVQ